MTKNKFLLSNSFILSAVSFLSIFFGLKILSGFLPPLPNIFMLLGFCMLLGVMSSLLYWLGLKYAYYFFNSGLLIGLLAMIWTLFKNLDGWEDLAALASLFFFILTGFCAGLLIELGYFLYRKFGKKS